MENSSNLNSTDAAHFCAYSQYYDLLYQDKDYAGEVAYVNDLVRRSAADAKTLLELGSGSGKHAELLANAGWQVDGVEMSETMLKEAKKRQVIPQDATRHGAFEAHLGDARTFRIEKTYDAVVSLFHVVSYQTSNDDVIATFKTAASHLTTGGLFVFDVWYGPAVTALRPEARVKRMENESIGVIRIAEPKWIAAENRVDVNYTILATDKASGRTEQLSETHPMRYFGQLEIDLLARLTGFSVVHCEEWMTGSPPSENTWGVTFVLQKNQ